MKHRIVLCACAILGLCLCTTRVSAMIFISEILADPPPGILGDADGNGVRSSSGDEFIEIFNDSSHVIDLTGWTLTDAVATRHVYSQTIGPKEYLAIFGSSASTGALGLNNSSDMVSLFDDTGSLIDQVSFG